MVFENLDFEKNLSDVDDVCVYSDVTTVKSCVYGSASSLNVIHLNVRSLRSKCDELLCTIQSTGVNFSVIVLSETWLRTENELMDIPGYYAFHSIRQNRLGGGVSILVSNSLSAELVPSLTLNNNIFETCGIRLSHKKKAYYIVGVYRPPGLSIDNFNNNFFRIFDTINIQLNTIILGDFNINISHQNDCEHSRVFIEEFRSLNFVPKINIPTRITDTSETVIDHMWCNFYVPCKSSVLTLDISDHYATVLSVEHFLDESENYRKIKFRDFSEVNIENFRTGVTAFVNNFALYDFLGINERCNVFCVQLKNIFTRSFPIKSKLVSARRYNSPWLSDSLINDIKEKNRLFKLSRNNVDLLPRYRACRNLILNRLRSAKSKYFRDKFAACAGNTKSIWKLINNTLKPNANRQFNYTLKRDDAEVTDPTIISNKFNEYFSSVAINLANNIPHVDVDPLIYVKSQINSFFCSNTDAAEVESIIRNFKSKQSNINDIPNFLYKYVADLVSPLVANLINSSFEEGVFPEVLKVARVIPLHKSGDKSVIGNFRPISVLPVLSKIFEKVMHKRVSNFLEKFNILNDRQFGFRSKKSTCDAILGFTENCFSAFNNGEYFVSVFLDFSKAFDTVDHSILLRKLEKIGFRGTTLSWFKCYLHGRHQYVDIHGNFSCLKEISLGVPQGSILGPLLFIVYINDMSSCSNYLNFVHYADDTTLYCNGRCCDDMLDMVNAELLNVDRWLCCNKLSLNVKKSAYMIFSSRQYVPRTKIIIRSQELAVTNSAKFLGVQLDNKLNFSNHIDYVRNKISRSCGILKKLSYHFPAEILHKLYYTMVHPHVSYCLEIWGSSFPSKLVRVKNLHKKSLQVIDERGRNTLNILSFDQLYEYLVLIKLFKYFVLGESVIFQSRFIERMTDHNYLTRFNCNRNFIVPNVKRSKYFNSFLYNGIHFWNKLPNECKNVYTLNAFKTNLKSMYFSNIV